MTMTTPSVTPMSAYCSYCDANVPPNEIGGGNRHKVCGWYVYLLPRRRAATEQERTP